MAAIIYLEIAPNAATTASSNLFPANSFVDASYN
eukprot:XP_001705569.1 Hypothetical protein GL50803_9915 [Giardia lamblia ATCC 50803]